MCRDASTAAIDFGVRDDITDVITRDKFCDNRFRGFGVLIPTILRFSIGLIGRAYNSLRTTMLHCDVYTAGDISRCAVSLSLRSPNVT